MKVSGTKEWAAKNINIVSGCSNNCKYCYAREMAIRFKRKTSDSWKNEENLKSVDGMRIGHVDGKIMFPSSHDITPSNIDLSIATIRMALDKNNSLLIVSKPHIDCIKRICNEFHDFKKQILFRFSIGSANNETLRFWESDAPLYEERIESLKYAFNKGFETSISCEPMLDNQISVVIEEVLPYVTDSIWVGKMNKMLGRLKINGFTDKETRAKATQLLEWQQDSEILKIYNRYKDHPKIKWKESIKKVVGIDISDVKGLDI